MGADALLDILLDMGREIEAAGGGNCDARGIAHGCRCAHCVASRRMKLRVKAMRQRQRKADQ